MCRIDDAERVNIITDEFRKARKAHKCAECNREIKAGEQYRYEFGTIEGTTDEYKTCAHCLIARTWLLQNCGGWIYTQVIEEIQDHAQEYPKLAFPLYRLVVGGNRKWKRFTGDALMPLAAIPPPITVHEKAV